MVQNYEQPPIEKLKIMKTLVIKFLKRFGWELVRINAKIPRENFELLAKSYEFEISKSRNVIGLNPRRYKLLGDLIGTTPAEAYYIIESLARTMHLEGDVCEFGVAQGRTSGLIANELLGTKRKLHLFDSFTGLPAPSAKDELIDDIFGLGAISAYEGLMSVPSKEVTKVLSTLGIPKSAIVIHQGFIEDTLRNSTELPKKVTFAYIDFDFYEGIFSALSFVDEVSIVGTELIVDDYGFFSSGAKLAVDSFLQTTKTNSWKCNVAEQVNGYFALLTRIS